MGNAKKFLSDFELEQVRHNLVTLRSERRLHGSIIAHHLRQACEVLPEDRRPPSSYFVKGTRLYRMYAKTLLDATVSFRGPAQDALELRNTVTNMAKKINEIHEKLFSAVPPVGDDEESFHNCVLVLTDEAMYDKLQMMTWWAPLSASSVIVRTTSRGLEDDYAKLVDSTAGDTITFLMGTPSAELLGSYMNLVVDRGAATPERVSIFKLRKRIYDAFGWETT